MRLRSEIIFFVLVFSLTSCAPVYTNGISVQPPVRGLSTEGSDVAAPLPADYLINSGDLLSIKFPRRPAYSDNFLVRPDGKITAPSIGSVPAAGRTFDQVQQDLVLRYLALVQLLPPPSQRRYLLQADDLLDIRFPYIQELNSEVTIRGDGRISLPLIGEVVAETKTPEELTQELTTTYRQKLGTQVDLVVIVKEPHSNVYESNGVIQPVPDSGLAELSVNVVRTIPLLVYVAGEVPAPGTQPYAGSVSALQAIYAAGGAMPTGDMRSVVILRRGADDGVIRIVSNLTNDLVGNGTEDVALRPFDVVIVPRSSVAKVGDALDQYVYRLIRPLANSYVGFFFTRQVGAAEQKLTTTPGP